MEPEKTDHGTPARDTLGIVDIACIVIGGIVGVGIFFTPARVVRESGGADAALVAWSLGAVAALLGAFTFASLAAILPRHGGTFAYILEAFGRMPAFLFGWANLTVIQSGALAVVAIVLVDHVEKALGVTIAAGSKLTLACAAIALFAALNYLGLRVGKGTQNLLTGLKVVAVFGLAASCLLAAAAPPADGGSATTVIGAGSLSAALLPVMFSFGGWQQGSFVAGAARQARRTVPLGIVIGVVVVAAAYLSINIGVLHVLGERRAAASSTIAAEACSEIFGPMGERVMAAVVAVSAAGILNTICLAPPYVVHAMAEARLVPSWAGRLHPRFGGPAIAVIIEGSWAVGLLLLHSATRSDKGSVLDVLMDGVVFADWVFFSLAGAACLVLRGRGLKAPFDAGGTVSAAFTLVAVAIAAGAVWSKPGAAAWGAAVLFLGVLVHAWLQAETSSSRDT